MRLCETRGKDRACRGWRSPTWVPRAGVGEEPALPEGAGGPRRAQCREPRPQAPSSSLRGWGNPSVRLPSPPFPFLLVPRGWGGRVAGRGSRAEPGARRGRSGPRPRDGGGSRPLHPQLRAGLPWARPVGARAGTQASRWAPRLGGEPRPPLSVSLVRGRRVGLWPIWAPSCGFSQMTSLQPTHPHLRLTFSVDASPSLERFFQR